MGKHDKIEEPNTISEDNLISSIVMYPKKMVRKRSIISLIKNVSRKRYGSGADRSDLTAKELRLFSSILARKENEEKYEIKKKVSAGGMGNIFYVFDKDFRRHTILKMILPEHKQNSVLIRSFIREARITGQLEHPNIVPVHDLGYLPNFGIYFTMKYVEGESLLDIIRQLERGNRDYHDRYDFYTLLNIFRKICDAVSFSHSKKIIHRDIKPANIMVGNYGEALLMDWGLAKNASKQVSEITPRNLDVASPGSHRGDATRFGIIKGTPAYMAPEQAIGDTKNIDYYSDIFLLGATLYHLFTYQPPYSGTEVLGIIKKAQGHDMVPPEELCFKNQQLSKELCRIISKSMAAEKGDRYQSVQEMSSDLDDLIHGKMEFNTRTFEPGEYLVREGELGVNSFIILKGRVDVHKDIRGKIFSLGQLNEGDSVGEMALITDAPRTASAVALEATEALELDKRLFTHNLEKLPSWMEKTIVALADRLSDANTRLADK